MAKPSSGSKKSSKQVPQISLLDAREFLFEIDGSIVNVEDATDEQFDEFIRHHVKVGWSLEDRVDAINTALAEGKTLGVLPTKNQMKNQTAI